MQFHFGNHVLDVDRRELRRGSDPIAVEPQVFDLLIYLVQNRDRVVSKDDLIASVWGGRIVSDSTLTSRINAARKAVGDSGGDQKLIRTIARKGLRFVGVVRAQTNGNEPAHVTGSLPDEIREQSRPGLPLPDRPAIAVLPFVNMSGDPEQEYFSDGISEDITTALSKLRWFFVIARNSSFTYKGKAVHMKQVAEELGVGYVVEGSVRKSGDRVRITVQLNDVATGSHIWGERYDRDLADVFAVQDEITEAIVAAIEPQIYAAENFHARRKPPDSMDAWDLVMRALSLSYCGRWEEADKAARRALRLSPRDPFAAVYAGIAAYAQFIGRNYNEAMQLAREAIRQRGDFVGAHRVLTAAAGMAGQTEVATAALQELRRAQPNISLAWIAEQMPIKLDADREHYLEAFRRAGLD
jgi:TolB-like protein